MLCNQYAYLDFLLKQGYLLLGELGIANQNTFLDTKGTVKKIKTARSVLLAYQLLYVCAAGQKLRN